MPSRSVLKRNVGLCHIKCLGFSDSGLRPVITDLQSGVSFVYYDLPGHPEA